MEGVMRKFTCLSILFLVVALSELTIGAPQSDVEKKKIEFLLNQIANLKGAKFWRNGSSHSPKEAVDHLRMKWTKAGGSVKTAQDFIQKIASKSSVSGKAYEIEFADGKKTELKDFLYQKLESFK